jgi:hypothetical protein
VDAHHRADNDLAALDEEAVGGVGVVVVLEN